MPRSSARIRKAQRGGETVYIWRASMVDPATGRRHQPQRTFRTRRAAEEHDAAWLSSYRAGEAVVRSQMTLAELAEEWLAMSRHAIAGTTLERYEGHWRCELAPVLGTVRMQALTPERIQHAYVALLDAGYARATVRSAHAMLALLLDHAVLRRLLTTNPARRATRVLRRQRSEDQEAEDRRAVWSRAEAHVLFARMGEARYGLIYALCLGLGLRRGEVLGLRWADLDLPPAPPAGAPEPAGRLRVVQTVRHCKQPPYYELGSATKSPASRRFLPLPGPLCASLRAQRERVASLRRAAGPAWENHDLVFPKEDGSPTPPHVLWRDWYAFLERADLPRITLHRLRHSFGSIALAGGMPITLVSRLLGHSSPAVTMRVYAHLIRELEEEASDRLTALFWPSPDGTSAPIVREAAYETLHLTMAPLEALRQRPT